jgi:chromosome segregation ATPase
LAAYNRDKAALQSEISAYNAHKKEYEEKVAYWNERGGAPRQDYQRLERDRTELNAEMANLAQKTEALRNLADQVNETVNALNRMAREFNIQVNEYNEVGASVGKEFDEGEYVRDGNGTRITIYQFEDKGKLERVLIHELGHALGLEHVENPKAIMYRLNIGSNSRLAPEDLAGLKLVCEITS